LHNFSYKRPPYVLLIVIRYTLWVTFSTEDLLYNNMP
jgi:hypothetical protein